MIFNSYLEATWHDEERFGRHMLLCQCGACPKRHSRTFQSSSGPSPNGWWGQYGGLDFCPWSRARKSDAPYEVTPIDSLATSFRALQRTDRPSNSLPPFFVPCFFVDFAAQLLGHPLPSPTTTCLPPRCAKSKIVAVEGGATTPEHRPPAALPDRRRGRVGPPSCVLRAPLCPCRVTTDDKRSNGALVVLLLQS